MVMAWMIPGEDEQPATRRDLAKEREIIEASMRAGQAEMRAEMTEGFRQIDDKISGLRTDMVEGFRQTDDKISGLRTDMVEGFRQTDDKINKLSTKVDVRLTNQTRFLAGLMIAILAAVLSGR